MRNVYSISLQLPTGGMVVFSIVAPTMASACAAAISKAGLPANTEPHTQQRLTTVDIEVA